MRRGPVGFCGLALFAAAPAAAQPVIAPQSPPQDEEAAETGVGPTAPAAEVRPYLPPPAPLSDLAYDSRIRASMASAQGFQGALDGGWTMNGPEGRLYAFQLVDRGTGSVEGAWRDLRKPGALDVSGFVDRVEQTGAVVVLRFGGDRVAKLRTAGEGRWTGELQDAGGTRPVSLTRSNP